MIWYCNFTLQYGIQRGVLEHKETMVNQCSLEALMCSHVGITNSGISWVTAPNQGLRTGRCTFLFATTLGSLRSRHYSPPPLVIEPWLIPETPLIFSGACSATTVVQDHTSAIRKVIVFPSSLKGCFISLKMILHVKTLFFLPTHRVRVEYSLVI